MAPSYSQKQKDIGLWPNSQAVKESPAGNKILIIGVDEGQTSSY